MRRWLWPALFALALIGCDGESTPTPDAAAPDMGETPDMDDPAEPDMASVEPDMAVVEPDVGPRPDMGDPCPCPGRQTCDENGDCVEPEMCMGHEDCIAPRACVDGVCEDRCRDDTDCPRALRCDAGTQECVEAVPCDGDSGCFEGRRCIDGTCVDPCVEDDDCPGRQTCDDDTGRCQAPETCRDDADCPGEAVCVAGGCVPPCAESADCPGAQDCIEGVCSEPAVCNGPADCQGDRLCFEGGCIDPCGRVGCPGDLGCDGETGRCEEAAPCFGDDGCRGERRCLDGACIDPCAEAADCPGAQQCVDGECTEPGACFGDADCNGDRICDENACADPCGRAGCPGALACDEATGRCAEVDPCRNDAQCRGDRTCIDGACTEPCRENADCPGNLTCGADGRCGEPNPCFGDLDCFDERVCVEGQCTDPCGPGQPCVGTQICEAGRCVEGEDCADDRDCLGDRRCHPEGQVCVDPCRDDADCRAGAVCGDDGLCGERDTCDADGNCLGERLCRLGRCRTVRCEETAECPDDEICVDWQCRRTAPGTCECPGDWRCPDGRCVAPGPCEDDADCPVACREDGTCGECREGADCPGAAGCRDNTCVEPAVCLGEGACLPGRICGPGDLCIGDPECLDDPLAPNDIPEAAAPLVSMAVTGLVACDGVDDWFRVATDDTLLITARFAGEGPPLRLTLFPIFDAFTAVDDDRGTPGQSWVSSNTPGEYLLRVRRPPGGVEDYGLEVSTGAPCVDDGFERPWRNDDEASAAVIDADFIATRCGEGDVDWYRYDGVAPAEVAVAGPVIATIDGAPADVIEPGQTMRITGDADGGYTVRLEPVRDPAGRCEDAPLIAPGEATRVFVQEGPDDFAPECFPEGAPDAVFRVEMPGPGSLRATFDGFPPMAQMALYTDCGAAPLQCSGGIGAFEVDALDAGTYYLAIDGPLEGDLTVEPTADFACADAPAIAPGVPTPVELAPTPGRIAGGCLGEGSVAVRRLTLAAPAAVTVGVEGEGQLALTVRADCEAAATEVGCERGFGPQLDAGVLPAGDHYVLVEGEGAATITVTAVPAGQAPTLADGCDGPVAALAPGAVVQLEGSTLGAADDVDAAVCQRAGGGPDQVLRFSVAEPVALRAELLTEGHLGYLILLDGQCGGEPTCGTALNPTLDANVDAGEYALAIDGQAPDDAGGYTVRLVVEEQ